MSGTSSPCTGSGHASARVGHARSRSPDTAPPAPPAPPAPSSARSTGRTASALRRCTSTSLSRSKTVARSPTPLSGCCRPAPGFRPPPSPPARPPSAFAAWDSFAARRPPQRGLSSSPAAPLPAHLAPRHAPPVALRSTNASLPRGTTRRPKPPPRSRRPRDRQGPTYCVKELRALGVLLLQLRLLLLPAKRLPTPHVAPRLRPLRASLRQNKQTEKRNQAQMFPDRACWSKHGPARRPRGQTSAGSSSGLLRARSGHLAAVRGQQGQAAPKNTLGLYLRFGFFLERNSSEIHSSFAPCCSDRPEPTPVELRAQPGAERQRLCHHAHGAARQCSSTWCVRRECCLTGGRVY
jgi:hypothetical protein